MHLLRKVLHSFIASSSSSSTTTSSSFFLYPLSNYSHHRCFLMQRNYYGFLFSFSSCFSVQSLPQDTLLRRLLAVSHPDTSVVPVLNQWVDEGRQVDYYNVRFIIKILRNYERYVHALQISEWMNDTKYFKLTDGDAAFQLDLIAKVHGLDQAEKFFTSMPDESIAFKICNSLLNCYANVKALDKAEAFMEEMKRLGFAEIRAHNVMLNLYYQMGEHEKFNFLIQEMEEKGIYYNNQTYCIRLNAYVAASDIVGMEKLLMKMEADPLVSMDWDPYCVAANGYMIAGALEKAQAVLMKFEQIIRGGRRRHEAYSFLITLYGKMGKKEEVYRIWNRYKNFKKISNVIYIIVLRTLVKLGDLYGAEMELADWLEKTKVFDSRVPQELVIAYCRKGHIEKAESLISKLIENGNEPSTNTWMSMAWGYSKNGQMERAVDMIEKSIASQHKNPHLPTLAHCLHHLNSKGDIDRARKIIGLLEDQGKFPQEFRNDIERYIEVNLAPKEFDEMEQESETLEAEDFFGDIGSQNKSTS